MNFFLLNAQETEFKDIYELKNKIDSLRLLTDFLLYDQLILNGDISLTYEQNTAIFIYVHEFI